MAGGGFAIFRAFGINHLGDAWFEHRVEVVTHLDKDVFTFATVFTVKIYCGMSGG